MLQNMHLRAPDNWINDPNGFIYYKGIYHLFYQYFPYGPRWGTMHWGHAISKDLVTWEHRGLALFPTCYEDQNGCFSGSAVEYQGRLYLYYTGVHYHEPNPEDIHVCLHDNLVSSQLMIMSEDGFHFDNFHGKHVIIPPITDGELGHPADTRDPKVWRGQDAWYLVLGSRTQQKNPRLLFYKSENLMDWSFVNSAATNAPMGWMWECPDYFETENGKVLVLSPMGFSRDQKTPDPQTICTLVDFEEETCTMRIPETYQYLDYGLDLYAAQSTTDENGRRILVAWARMPEPVEGRWSGMFCMPRVVEVKNGHIYFRLHPNLKAQYQRPVSCLKEAGEAGIHIRTELAEQDYIRIGGYEISRKGGKIHADRSRVFGNHPEYRLKLETPKIQEGNLLDIYVEEHLIEIYVNDGEYVLSSIVYGLGNEIQVSEGLGYIMETGDIS